MNATATARPRQRKPRPKPARFVRLVIRPDADSLGVVRVTVDGQSADYLLTPLPADFGRGFRVEKIGLEGRGEVYHVNLDGTIRTQSHIGLFRRCSLSIRLPRLPVRRRSGP